MNPIFPKWNLAFSRHSNHFVNIRLRLLFTLWHRLKFMEISMNGIEIDWFSDTQNWIRRASCCLACVGGLAVGCWVTESSPTMPNTFNYTSESHHFHQNPFNSEGGSGDGSINTLNIWSNDNFWEFLAFVPFEKLHLNAVECQIPSHRALNFWIESKWAQCQCHFLFTQSFPNIIYDLNREFLFIQIEKTNSVVKRISLLFFEVQRDGILLNCRYSSI